MVFVGTGIVLGGFVGLLSVTVAGIPLTLTASGGALVMGLRVRLAAVGVSVLRSHPRAGDLDLRHASDCASSSAWSA